MLLHVFLGGIRCLLCVVRGGLCHLRDCQRGHRRFFISLRRLRVFVVKDARGSLCQ